MVTATVKVHGDLTPAVEILTSGGAKVLMTSARTNSIAIKIEEEQFYNLFKLYPNFVGHQKVQNSYSSVFDFVEIAPPPTYF